MCTSIDRYVTKKVNDGRKAMLIDLLTMKLGSLSSKVINHINDCSNDELNTIKNSIFTIQSEEDIVKLF